MSYFNKILIANRGEIARRIIRTCRRLGIISIAVYSDADKDTPFVREADKAYYLGPSQAKKSYLDVEKIIDAAKKSNAEAIHPGYGFLSENPTLAQRCKQEGITFIGPDQKFLQLMGNKIEARQRMKKAGVPIVPGWDGKLQSVDQTLEIAENLGYPLMLKASAGGGGIGMELISNKEEVEKFFHSTMQRANSAFGDGTVFLERYISSGRHIEVQVAGDHHGNTIHLFERECSIQRRNQKVIEETPSPILDKEIRQKLCETALRGIKELDYTNVGTIEFIFDENTGEFYFLEMNTRLQVEHPVTEEVTNIDLVELQIKIAANEPMQLVQEEIQQQGYAIECRLYAEDPETYFPSPGKIQTLRLPEKNARFDFAFEEGNTISPFYDPMIGKIVVHADTRRDALTNMKRVLQDIEIEGVTTNLPLLKDIIEDNNFQSGDYTTRYLVEERKSSRRYILNES